MRYPPPLTFLSPALSSRNSMNTARTLKVYGPLKDSSRPKNLLVSLPKLDTESSTLLVRIILVPSSEKLRDSADCYNLAAINWNHDIEDLQYH
jgi:hypothetical protein